jgi:hypothetical protein
VSGANQSAKDAEVSATKGISPLPPADVLFEPPPGYEVVGEDVFLDELLDAFLSSIAVDGQHEVGGCGGSPPAARARAHLD